MIKTMEDYINALERLPKKIKKMDFEFPMAYYCGGIIICHKSMNPLYFVDEKWKRMKPTKTKDVDSTRCYFMDGQKIYGL